MLKALAGYKEINLRAMRLLRPGGYLVTCSCSYNVSEAMFRHVLYQASVDSHTPMTSSKSGAGTRPSGSARRARDEYLKCFILRKLA